MLESEDLNEPLIESKSDEVGDWTPLLSLLSLFRNSAQFRNVLDDDVRQILESELEAGLQDLEQLEELRLR